VRGRGCRGACMPRVGEDRGRLEAVGASPGRTSGGGRERGFLRVGGGGGHGGAVYRAWRWEGGGWGLCGCGRVGPGEERFVGGVSAGG